jgi:hypothetical protein
MGAPVVVSSAQGVLQHRGMMKSEEGRSIDDGELGRVELTERGQSGGGSSKSITDGVL